MMRRAGATLALVLGLTTATVDTAASDTLRIPLPFERTDLSGGFSATRARVHLPPGLAVRRARLVVGYANTLAGDPRFSTLEVIADGRPLVRLPLVGAQEPIEAEIDVPSRLISTGQVELQIVARQRHRAACSRESHEQLWARLDPEPSALELEVDVEGSTRSLAGLEALLANSLIDRRTLQIATRRPVDDVEVLAWGGLASEAIALRRPARQLPIRHVRFPASERDDAAAITRDDPVLFIGTFDELAGLLPANLPAGANQGLIALLERDGPPGTFALAVTGRDPAAVRAALGALGAPRAWPDGSLAAVPRLPPADVPPASRHQPVTPGETALRELGYTSRDLPLGFTGTLEVPFVMPNDSYAGDGQRVTVRLDFAYGAGLAPNSALIVRVNGAPWNRLKLDDPAGAIVEGAAVDLPMGLFAPGPNVIGFEPVLHPGGKKLCGVVGDQPMFSLFESSRIEVPRFARLAHQPDLRLFGATGFPYGDRDVEPELILGSGDPLTIAAAWMLRGRLAAARGRALGDLRTSFGSGGGGRDLLFVGAVPDLPQAVVSDAPVPLLALIERRVAAAGPVAPGTAGEPGSEPARLSWEQRLGINAAPSYQDRISRLADRIISAARAMPAVDDALIPFEELYPGDEHGRAGTLLAFRSPFDPERTATVFTATSRSALAVAANDLVRPPVWDRLEGDLSVWGPDGSSVRSRRVAPVFLASPIDWSAEQLILFGRAHLARNPTHWLVLVFGLLGLLAGATALVLRRRSLLS